MPSHRSWCAPPRCRWAHAEELGACGVVSARLRGLSAPMVVWVFMISNSPVETAGLEQDESGIPTLPMSCRGLVRSMRRTYSGVSLAVKGRCQGLLGEHARVVADALEVGAGLGVAGLGELRAMAKIAMSRVSRERCARRADADGEFPRLNGLARESSRRRTGPAVLPSTRCGGRGGSCV